MSGNQSYSEHDYSSSDESEVELSPEELRQQQIRQKKLDALVKARGAAKKSLALKSSLTKNAREIKKRERLLELSKQQEKKRQQAEEFCKIERQNRKLEKMKASKPAKKKFAYKEPDLPKEPESSSSSES